MLLRAVASLLVLNLICPPASAAEDETGDAGQAVQVSGTKDPELRPYKTMLKGLDAFEAHHSMAPTAPLRFKLIAQKADLNLNDVSLRIAGEETSIALKLAEDGTFVLPRDPQALAENADLLLNKKKGLFRWRPDVHSAGVPPNMRRLGDLRLECEVRWAVEAEDLPLMTRTLFRAAGGPCSSKNINVVFAAAKKGTSASLVAGERRIPLELAPDGLRYIAPLHDKSWNDDALVVLEFADTPQ